MAGVELGMLGVTAREAQQVGFQVGDEGAHHQADTAGVGDVSAPRLEAVIAVISLWSSMVVAGTRCV
jgi:hypothetical protein